MLADNHQQLHHKFLEFYIYQGNILAKKRSIETALSQVFESYIDQEQNQIQEKQVITALSRIS